MKSSYSKGVLCCLVATLSWGAMFPLMTQALERIDPYTFTSLRYGLAGIAFALVLIFREGVGSLDLRGQRPGLAWLLGTAGFAGFGFLVFLGQKLAGAQGALTASIMMATMPMLGILVNWGLRNVRPRPISVLFILMSFVGVVTVITKGNYGSILNSPRSYGADVLIILGALCWVIYTVGASFFPKWSPLKYTTVTTLLGMVSVLAFNAVFLATGFVAAPSTADLAYEIPYLLYMAFVAGFIGVLCWNIGNKAITPVNGVLFMDVVPITAFTLSALIGMRPSPVEIFGAATTGLALIFNNLYLRRRTAVSAAAQAAPERMCLDGVTK